MEIEEKKKRITALIDGKLKMFSDANKPLPNTLVNCKEDGFWGVTGSNIRNGIERETESELMKAYTEAKTIEWVWPAYNGTGYYSASRFVLNIDMTMPLAYRENN